MLWALFALSVIEAGAVHLLITLRWPAVGWTLAALSAATAVWLVLWIRSWSRLPHLIEGEVLVLRMGSLRRIDLPLRDIATVDGITADTLKAAGTRNLVPIAYPNRVITLSHPHGRRGVVRYAIRVDAPEEFDAAMVAASVPVMANPSFSVPRS